MIDGLMKHVAGGLSVTLSNTQKTQKKNPLAHGINVS